MTRALQQTDGQPDAGGLSEADRAALAALWTGVACGGTDDVAVLAELVLVLSALGAPPALVARAASCSAGQAASAAAGRALAGVYAGEAPAVAPRPALLAVPPGGVRRPSTALRRLALRALRDGWLVGGHAAQVTSWAAATCTDPSARSVLGLVARSEAAQAQLWRDVLEWALAREPHLLARLRRVDLVETSPFVRRPAGADPAVLAAHGWPRPEEVARLWAAHRAAVVAGLAADRG